MNKLQEQLNEYKGVLWDGGYEQLVVDTKSGEDYQGVIIYGRVNDMQMTTFSLNDLIFGTQFVRLLQWNEIYFDMRLYGDIVRHDRTVKTTHKLTDTGYILCRLAIMDTDEERVKFIEDNTHL